MEHGFWSPQGDAYLVRHHPMDLNCHAALFLGAHRLKHAGALLGVRTEMCSCLLVHRWVTLWAMLMWGGEAAAATMKTINEQ